MSTSLSAPLGLPPPSELGLPARYSLWRPYQEPTVTRAVNTSKPYVVINAPTGAGKSVTGEVISMFLGRSIYNVGTLALQDQIVKDSPHRFNISGKANYDCKLLLEHGQYGRFAKCDRAEILCEGCAHKDRGCLYFDAWRQAKSAQHVITNYAYWLSINKYNEEGIGVFDVGIFDEAHAIRKQLANFLRIDLSAKITEQFTRRPLPSTMPLKSWIQWAGTWLMSLKPRYDAMQAAKREGGPASPDLKDLKIFVTALEDLRAMSEDWIEDRSDARASAAVSFEPRSPAPYAHLLFGPTMKRVLMSATIVPKDLELIGVPLDLCEFIEVPSSFPIDRRRVIHVSTVQMRATMSEDQRLEAVRRVDQIIDRRLDRNGIIHTKSFDRAQHLRGHAARPEIMLLNEAGNSASTDAMIRKFKSLAGSPPWQLVGPSFTTGYNFPMMECEYQIIYKLPFLDTRSPVEKARQEDDPDYGLLEMIKEFIQTCGRGMRSANDRCENLVIDDQILWAFPKCVRLGFVPGWFAGSVMLGSIIPKPPEKLI